MEVDAALHPLMVVDATRVDDTKTGESRLALSSTRGVFYLNDETGLTPESAAAGAAFISLPNRLTALFTRAAWYRLVDMADDDGCVESTNTPCFNYAAKAGDFVCGHTSWGLTYWGSSVHQAFRGHPANILRGILISQVLQ